MALTGDSLTEEEEQAILDEEPSRLEQQAQEMYKPVTKKTGEYPRNLRAKVNTTGVHSARYWDANKERADPPTDHTGLAMNARVLLRGLWFGPEAWGLVCDATDLQLLKEEAECPF